MKPGFFTFLTASKIQKKLIFNICFRKNVKTYLNTVKKDKEKKINVFGNFKKIIKQHKIIAVGLLTTISILDYVGCYLFVRKVGREKIEEYIDKIKTSIGFNITENLETCDKIEPKIESEKSVITMTSYYKKLMEKMNFSWPELVIAYGIHKSLIFLRLTLTIILTPRVARLVKKLKFNL